MAEFEGILGRHSQSFYVLRGQVDLLDCAAKRTENNTEKCFNIPPFCSYTF